MKFHQGPALRAIFKVSAGPRDCSMGGVRGLAAWNLGGEFWISTRELALATLELV